MAMTTVHLLRHGEVHNPDQLLYGRMPHFRLSERGEGMAQAVAAYLAGEDGPTGPALTAVSRRHDVTVVTSSPLLRARQTAAPIGRAFGLTVGVDSRLVEAGNRFEGHRVTLARLASPRWWRYYTNPMRPSWGEPYLHQVLRVSAAIETARLAALGHEAVLVSHQLPIWATRLAFEGKRLAHHPNRRECTLASLTSFTFDGERLVAIGYSEPAAHLSA